MQGIRKRPRHILTFDLEEHFHASRFDSPMRQRYMNLDKTAGRLHQLLADFQFGPVCELVLPIGEQVRSASAQAVPDSATGDHLNGSPQLTTV